MTVCNGGADYVSAPRDIADLFRIYQPYIIALARKFGIEESRVEDVASEILLRLMEKDVIGSFDPTRVFDYEGQRRPARFKSYLTKIVMQYLKGHRDKQYRQRNREPLLCDAPVARNKDALNGAAPSTWIEMNGPTTEGPEEVYGRAVDAADTLAILRAHMKTVPPRNRYDGCDLPVFFELILSQIAEHGTWSPEEIRAHFKISTTAAHSWNWRTREQAALALGLKPPVKRARVLKK